jgi:hypothetical protein
MILIIAMVILVIIIISLIIRYVYVQANILSSKEFRKTAEKKSAKMRIKNPQITCDYCGCIINTDKEKKCPNCGAVYGDDKELKQRYKVDEAAVEKMADAAAKDAVSRAHKEGLETLKHIRIAIIVLLVVFVLMVVYSEIMDRRTSTYTNTSKYRGNEVVKDYNYKEYTLIDSPDVTVFDQDGVTVRIVSIYADTTNGEYNDQDYSYRVGFTLKNKRKEPVRFTLKCVGINGRCKYRDYIYTSSEFRGNSEVTYYESVYGEWFDSIDEMVIGEVGLRNEEGDIYEKTSMETFKLNDEGYTVITKDKDKGSVIFANHKIRIRSIEKENSEYGYELWIDNISEKNYYIDDTNMKIDGEACNSYVLYNSGLPAGYTLHHDSVNGLGDEFRKRSADSKVEVSFSLSDPVDPSNDFSTGYIELK